MNHINKSIVSLLTAISLPAFAAPGLADGNQTESRGNNYVIAIGVDVFPQSRSFLSSLSGCVHDAVAYIQATQASGFIPEMKPAARDLDRARKAQTDVDRRQSYRTLLARTHYLLLADDPSGLPATKANILAAVQAAHDLTASEANPEKDVVLVEVASHGCELPDTGIYLCPQDTRIASLATRADDIQKSALPAHEFVTQLSGLPVKLVLASFDICRSDPRARSIRGAEDDLAAPVLTERMTRRMTPSLIPAGAKNVYSLFACSAGQFSYEIPEKSRGCFSYFLTKGLLGAAASEDGLITVGGLTAYVHKAVAAFTKYAQVPTGRLPSEKDLSSVEDIQLVRALRLKQIYSSGTVSNYQCDITLRSGDQAVSASADVTETILSSTDDGGVRVRFEMKNFGGTSVPNDFSLAPVTATLDQSANTLTIDAGPDQNMPSDFDSYILLSDLFDTRYFSFPDDNMARGKTWRWNHPTEQHKQSNGHLVAEPDEGLHGRATFMGLRQKVKNASSGQAWEVEVISDRNSSSAIPFDFTCLFDTADCQLVSLEGNFTLPNPNGAGISCDLSVHRSQVEAPEGGDGSTPRPPRGGHRGGVDLGTAFKKALELWNTYKQTSGK